MPVNRLWHWTHHDAMHITRWMRIIYVIRNSHDEERHISCSGLNGREKIWVNYKWCDRENSANGSLIFTKVQSIVSATSLNFRLCPTHDVKMFIHYTLCHSLVTVQEKQMWWTTSCMFKFNIANHQLSQALDDNFQTVANSYTHTTQLQHTIFGGIRVRVTGGWTVLEYLL